MGSLLLPMMMGVGMNFRAEAQAVLKTIKKAGANTTVKIIVPAKKDAFTGISSGNPTELTVYMAQVEYTDTELADSALANGLMKLVVSPLNTEEIEPQGGFIAAVKGKGTMVEFSDSRKLAIKVARITAPDGVTPILSRLFIGG